MDKLTVLVDPRSPWCYQTTRWLRVLEAAAAVELDWGLFSLELVNLHEDENPETFVAHYGPALRTATVVRERLGSKKMGSFYSELGRIIWEADIPEQYRVEQDMFRTTVGTARERHVIDKRSMLELSQAALENLQMEPSWAVEATNDQKTWQSVVAESKGWAESHQVFGVATLVFDEGNGPAVFGPVLKSLPDQDTCLDIWKQTSWLVKSGYFFELKKARDPKQLRVNLPNALWRTAMRVQLLREARREVATPGGTYEGASVDWMIAKLVEQGLSSSHEELSGAQTKNEEVA